jgi:hypothetical protein
MANNKRMNDKNWDAKYTWDDRLED